MIIGMRHVGIVVKDIEKSLDFWKNIMGLKIVIDFWEEGTFIDTVQGLEGVNIRMIKLASPDGIQIELLHDVNHPCERTGSNTMCDIGIRHIAFTVDNIQEYYNKFSELGLYEYSSPVLSPDGKAKLFFAKDPEGNILELVEIM